MAPPVQSTPAGVGFVNLDDDFGDDDDDDLIDEDTLLTEEDLMRPVNIPPECAPKAGKRRRACKDCSCGLAERLAAEDAAKRAAADAQLGAIQKQAANVKLAADDLAEVDFTVQGKVGSCGNCALGDAFRCDGCPYVGCFACFGPQVSIPPRDVWAALHGVLAGTGKGHWALGIQ
ncbi:Fe-S cluster assembly protein DRE2 like [Verticillium longisporum]|nr:Fe-S cluster assembly protein DRE2 like [Verticillium longisporum]